MAADNPQILKCADCAKFCDRFAVIDMKAVERKNGFLGIFGEKILLSVPNGKLIYGARKCSIDDTKDYTGKAKDQCLVPNEFEKATETMPVEDLSI